MIKESALRNFKNINIHGNRGMDLERMLNETNSYYQEHEIALIYKKPTPIGFKRTNSKGIIEEAFFKEKSTLDYSGVYKGHYLEFDAKETNNSKSFPLSNIKKHQTEHIKNVIKHGGIAFLIIKLKNDIYYLDGHDYIEYIETTKISSIPNTYFLEKAYLIKEGLRPSINYLKIIDKLYIDKDGYNDKEKK